jgi:hypothetical protein
MVPQRERAPDAERVYPEHQVLLLQCLLIMGKGLTDNFHAAQGFYEGPAGKDNP